MAEISGEEFRRLARALKTAGEIDLRKHLTRQMQAAAKPLIPQARAAARRDLPRRGGLAERVAGAPMRVTARTGQRDPGVRVIVGKRRGSGARAANAGTVRHPVFGTDRWVSQEVTPGWFTQTMEDGAPTVRPGVEQAIRDTLDEIVRRAR